MSRDHIPNSYYEIIDACAEPGCPFCRLVDEFGYRFLVAGMHGTITDPDTRLKYRESLGFCQRHAWLLPHTSDGARLGIAIIYRDFVRMVQKELKKARYKSGSGISFGRMKETLNRKQATTTTETLVKNLHPRQPCPACIHETEMETLAMTTLVDLLPQDERLSQAYQNSEGLCLPHLRHALELVRNQTAFDTLLEITQEKLAGLETELDEFERKHDHRYKHEKFNAEGDSWERALTKIIGMPGPKPEKRRSR